MKSKTTGNCVSAGETEEALDLLISSVMEIGKVANDIHYKVFSPTPQCVEKCEAHEPPITVRGHITAINKMAKDYCEVLREINHALAENLGSLKLV